MWGTGELQHVLNLDMPWNEEIRAAFAREERLAASPRTAGLMMPLVTEVDVRAVLPTVRVPTLVVHHTDDPVIPPAWGKYIADHIPGAKYVELPGRNMYHFVEPWREVTVLFADVVHSMDIAAAVGAERLREIMAELVNCSSGVVQRYGGTVDKFTGDGIMAVFGAPIALEDHAFRACLAALEIQKETQRLAVEVDRRDGVTLQLRVGLNSGQVIAGEIGSGATGYTALGEQVGTAQRMESVAPPGAVMLSESTGRLVEDAAVLAEPEMVRIKGADDPVPARRLLGVAPHRRMDGAESTFVGRQWEMSALAGMLRQAVHLARAGPTSSAGADPRSR